MKGRLFYILILFFVMIFAVSEKETESKNHNDISTCQSITLTQDINCVIPQFNFELKRNLPIFNNFQFFNPSTIKNGIDSKVESSIYLLKINKLKIEISHLTRLKPYHLRIYHSPQSIDEHPLS